MAEISETLRPATATITESETPETSEPVEKISEFDPKTMRRTKPGLKRLIMILTVLASFILGFPFLLKSIEIYRSPLPFREIDSLSNSFQSNPLHLPCRFQAVFLGFDRKGSLYESSVEKLGFMISEEMVKLTGNDPICGGCGNNNTVSVTIDSGSDCIRNLNSGSSCLWRCGSLDFSGFSGNLNDDDDDSVDDLLYTVLRRDESCSDSGGKVYTVVVMNREEDDGTRVVVGKHRHAWLMGKVSEMNAVSTIANVFVKFFMNGGKKEGASKAEFMPVGADGRIVLSFSLLNANPQDWIYDWDFEKIDEDLLAPVVEALAPIGNFSVESQVLYHTPKSSFSYWDAKLSSYVFSTKDLPFFVNSNEWHLDTSIAAGGRSKVLQFVVYVPSAEECPLRLQLPSGEISMTNGFISPMWGGVIVWNPPSCFRNSESRHPVKHTLPRQDLEKLLEVFMGQLRQLFGLNSDNLYVTESGITNSLSSERGFTEWELDVLSRQHTCFNLHSCATTLGSLSRLVQSLPRMIIMDEIGKQVKFSLEAASLAQANASLGIYEASAVSSRQARALAEDAFFHPSIMSISYYSFEHCFAIYTPFFLPVSLHILLAATKEWRRYKQERAKYLTWTSKAQARS